mmetsp:Transcript_579/g.1207  ORF Transcript_579/g.1207 Transcript_579/m.1207 type:complete len:220 (+) Transcript_579:79-738(+)
MGIPNKGQGQKQKPRGPPPKGALQKKGGKKGGGKKVRSLKNRIRDVEKLLAKEGISEELRAAMESKLALLQEEKAEKDLKEKERAFAVKYKKVKFFERKKVIKRIERTRNEMEAEKDEEKKKKLEEQLELEEKRLNYIVHFPPLEKYISLFPSTPHTEEVDEKQRKFMEEANERAAAALRARGLASAETGEDNEGGQEDGGEESGEEDGEDDFFDEGEE